MALLTYPLYVISSWAFVPSEDNTSRQITITTPTIRNKIYHNTNEHEITEYVHKAILQVSNKQYDSLYLIHSAISVVSSFDAENKLTQITRVYLISCWGNLL